MSQWPTVLLCVTLPLFSLSSVDPLQAQTRTTRPNDVGAEALGKAFTLSLSYQRMVTPGVGLQAGFMWYPEDDADVSAFAGWMFPLGGKLYVSRGNEASFIAAGGITIARGSETRSDPVKTSFFPHAGLGYESRSESGFLYRLTLYTILLEAEEDLSGEWPAPAVGRVLFWPGVYVGYAF